MNSETKTRKPRYATSAYAQSKELYRQARAAMPHSVTEGVSLGEAALSMRLEGDRLMAEVNS